MPQKIDKIPKHANYDDTIKDILDSIKFQNGLGNPLVNYTTDSQSVHLVYDLPALPTGGGS